MASIVGLLLSILVISLTIVVHEYGHYLAMVRNGVKVVEFTVGFGPTLWERQLKNGTWFRLKPILLGGYAKPVTEGEGAIGNASRWARFKIYMAGMFMNCCVAFVVFTGLFYAIGGIPVQLVPYLRPLHLPPALIPLVGAFLWSFGLWLATPVLVVAILTKGLGAFFAGTAGPIGILGMGAGVVAASPTPVDLLMNSLWFFGVLNVAIAGFNLLPLYPLDGGWVADLVIGKIAGKHADKASTGFRILSGSVMLLLIVSILAADLVKAVIGIYK